MGHYRRTPAELDRLSFFDALSMYLAALQDERRRWAYAASVRLGKRPESLLPGAFPESPDRHQRRFSRRQIDAVLQRSLERVARDHGVSVDEARKMVRWAPPAKA